MMHDLAPGTPKTYGTPWACKPSISRSARHTIKSQANSIYRKLDVS